MGEGFKISEAGYIELFEKYSNKITPSVRVSSVTDYKHYDCDSRDDLEDLND